MTMNNVILDKNGQPIAASVAPVSMNDLLKKIEMLQAQVATIGVVKKTRKINKTYATPILDTSTNIKYASKAATARALFPAEWEKNHFYFEVMNGMFNGRFQQLAHVERTPFQASTPAVIMTPDAPIIDTNHVTTLIDTK